MKKRQIFALCLACGMLPVMAQTKSGGISKDMLKDIQKEVQASPVNKALVNAVAANSIDLLAVNRDNAGAFAHIIRYVMTECLHL